MIHSEDGAKVETKITDEGELFIFCPKCKRIWETSMETIKKPRESGRLNMTEQEIDLDLGSDESVKTKLKTKKPIEAAKELFPDAF